MRNPLSIEFLEDRFPEIIPGGVLKQSLKQNVDGFVKKSIRNDW